MEESVHSKLLLSKLQRFWGGSAIPTVFLLMIMVLLLMCCCALAYTCKISWWAWCQGSPWAPRGLLGGIDQVNIQGSLSSEEPHPCKFLHALWRAKTSHTYTVPLVVFIFSLSTGIRAWVRAAYELLPLFMFVIFCFHNQGIFLFSPVEH